MNAPPPAETLQNVFIFRGMNADALGLLAGHAQMADFPMGTVIVREGEDSFLFYIISLGSVWVCKNHGTDKEVGLATLGLYEFFGERCIFDRGPRSATVQAITDVSLMCFSGDVFQRLCTDLPDQFTILLLNIARDLAERLRNLDSIYAARE